MVMKAVRDAVETMLAEQDDIPPIVSTWPTGSVPADGSTYLRVTYPVSNSEQQTFGAPGANVWREIGTIRIQVCGESGTDLDTALELADDIAAIFRGKTFGGVTIWAPTSPVINERNHQGAYESVSISVPYWFDYFG